MNISTIRPGDYGSTGTTPITKILQYTIFIIHNGQSTSEAFSVKALSNETVDDVKKLIKIVRTPALDKIPADKLRLVRVDIPDDPETNTDYVSLTLSPLTLKRSLRSTELLRDVFSDPPEQGKIHVVIESGEPVISAVAPCAHRAKNDDYGPWFSLVVCCGMICYVILSYVNSK